MEKIDVSIVVPVYNVENYLYQCLDSLINQSYKGIEIILVDDGSTDSSGDICDSLSKTDSRIRVIHKKNGGLSDARNVGIKNCNGDYVTCIDSDDIVTKDYVSILLEAAVASKSDIAIGKIIGLYDKEQEKNIQEQIQNKRIDTHIYTPIQALKVMLLQNEFDVSACAKLYKKDLFNAVEYPVGKWYEDLATTYKLIAKANQIVFCSEIIYGYRQNRIGSITSQAFSIKNMELLESFRGFYNYSKALDDSLVSSAECRYATCATCILTSLYFSADRSKYIKIEMEMKKAIRERAEIIINEKQLLPRRKIKILCAALGNIPYKIIYRFYFTGK